jgi:hypothetical protein
MVLVWNHFFQRPFFQVFGFDGCIHMV